MPVVRRASSADWEAIKATRLRALADAPGAFGSTLAREQAFADEKWRQRATRDHWFLAYQGERPAGIAAITDGGPVAHAMELVAMWVEPGARGDGLADALVETACASALHNGTLTIYLWVTDDNPRARRFYERNGFRDTGERQPLPSNPGVGEQRMRLLLSEGRPAQPR